jgi:hypothetical protein
LKAASFFFISTVFLFEEQYEIGTFQISLFHSTQLSKDLSACGMYQQIVPFYFLIVFQGINILLCIRYSPTEGNLGYF